MTFICSNSSLNTSNSVSVTAQGAERTRVKYAKLRHSTRFKLAKRQVTDHIQLPGPVALAKRQLESLRRVAAFTPILIFQTVR